MIDVDTLRAELATKHGLMVGKEDPVFALVYLNDALLRGFQTHMEATASTLERSAALACDLHVDRTRGIIEARCQAVTAALDNVSLEVPATAKAESERLIKAAFEPYAREIDARGKAFARLLEQMDASCERFARQTAQASQSRWTHATVLIAITGVTALLMTIAGHFLASAIGR